MAAACQRHRLCLVVAGLLLVLQGAAGQAPAPDLSAIPQRCLDSGGQIQALCSAQFDAAQAFFSANGSSDAAPGAPANVTQAQVEAFIAVAPSPTAECCKAACEFNAAYCSCEPAVLDFAVQVSGNDPATFESVARGFASACKFTIYLGASCPSPSSRITAAPDACVAPLPAGMR